MAKDVEIGYSKYEEPLKSYEYSPSTIPPPTAGMVLPAPNADKIGIMRTVFGLQRP